MGFFPVFGDGFLKMKKEKKLSCNSVVVLELAVVQGVVRGQGILPPLWPGAVLGGALWECVRTTWARGTTFCEIL